MEDLSYCIAVDPKVEQLSDKDYIPPDSPESDQQSSVDKDREAQLRPHA